MGQSKSMPDKRRRAAESQPFGKNPRMSNTFNDNTRRCQTMGSESSKNEFASDDIYKQEIAANNSKQKTKKRGRKNKSGKKRSKELREENEILKQELSSKEDECLKLQKENKNVQLSLSAANQSLAKSRDENKNLQRNLLEATEEKRNLGKRNEILHSKITALTAKNFRESSVQTENTVDSQQSPLQMANLKLNSSCEIKFKQKPKNISVKTSSQSEITDTDQQDIISEPIVQVSLSEWNKRAEETRLLKKEIEKLKELHNQVLKMSDENPDRIVRTYHNSKTPKEKCAKSTHESRFQGEGTNTQPIQQHEAEPNSTITLFNSETKLEEVVPLGHDEGLSEEEKHQNTVVNQQIEIVNDDEDDFNTTKTLHYIEEILKSIEKIQEQVKVFSGTEEDKTFLHLKEIIIRQILKLDNVESGGKDVIRAHRKQVIKHGHLVLEELKAKCI